MGAEMSLPYKDTVNCTVDEGDGYGKCSFPAAYKWSLGYICKDHLPYAMIAGAKLEELPEMPESLKAMGEQ